MASNDNNAPTEATPSLESRITKDSEPTTVPSTDGATENMNGSGLAEPEYDVQVTLNDMQADPNNPLFSVKSFEQLQL
jgi:ATP-dependent RNA helicase DDX19/DBP5